MEIREFVTLKNIFFDFDGTLGDSKELGNFATQEAFAHFDLTVPSFEQIAYYMGIPIEQSFIEMADRELLAEELQALLNEFRWLYKESEKNYLTLFPNAMEMLESLKTKGYKLFVVSSKHSESLLRNLDTLGIALFFDDVVGSDMVEKYKPNPESLDLLIKKYELVRDESIMIGDAIFDSQMGKAASVKTCSVTWGSHSEENLRAEKSDFIAHDNQELLKIIISN